MHSKGSQWAQQMKEWGGKDFQEFEAGTGHSAESDPNCLPNSLGFTALAQSVLPDREATPYTDKVGVLFVQVLKGEKSYSDKN